MRYEISHITRYEDGDRVSIGYNQAWLRPREDTRQRLIAHSLRISPEPAATSERVDFFGNRVTQFQLHEGYDRLQVEATSTVEILGTSEASPSNEQQPVWEDCLAAVSGPASPIDQFRYASPRVPQHKALAQFAKVHFEPGRAIDESLAGLCAQIHSDFEYDPSATHVNTPLAEAWELRRGVCQDLAHLMIGAARSVGLAARYVSGYLRTLPPPGKPRLIGADASHAWASIHRGPLGWIDYDPTNNCVVGSDHIVLAVGRDYADVPPLRGVFIGGGSPELSVSVDVDPVETPTQE